MPTYLPPNAGVQLSEAIRQAYASATVSSAVLLTLEIRHPSFVDESGNPTSAWIVNDFRNHTCTDESGTPHEFIGIPFRYTKPEQTDSGAPKVATLQIDNCSLEIARLLMLARESDDPVEVVEREYLSSDKTAPHVLPVTVLELNSPEITVESVSAQVGFGNLTNRKYPARTFQSFEFPGLAP